MKKIILTILIILPLILIKAQADVFGDVSKINKGVDGYIVGQALNKKQKRLLEKNGLKSEMDSVRRFTVNKNLLIAVDSKNNKVMAINKRFSQVKQEKTQSLISALIYDNGEPTVMAHDKIIYWVYDKDGKKLTKDNLEKYKDFLSKDKSKSSSLSDFLSKDKKPKKKVDFNPYLSIKLNSTQPMMSKEKEPKLADVYLMISSDKLISKVITKK